MNKMTGLFIGLGAILLFLLFIGFWPDGEDGLETVEALMKNPTLGAFYLLWAAVAFTMMQSGLILLSRQLISQASGVQAQWLTVANIGFMISITVFYVQGGLSLGAMELYADGNLDHAGMFHLIGSRATDAMPWSYGIGMFVLGWVSVSGVLKPKSGADWISGLLVIPGALFIIGGFVSNDGFWFISWIIMTLTLVILGGSLVFRRSQGAS